MAMTCSLMSVLSSCATILMHRSSPIMDIMDSQVSFVLAQEPWLLLNRVPITDCALIYVDSIDSYERASKTIRKSRVVANILYFQHDESMTVPFESYDEHFETYLVDTNPSNLTQNSALGINSYFANKKLNYKCNLCFQSVSITVLLIKMGLQGKGHSRSAIP